MSRIKVNYDTMNDVASILEASSRNIAEAKDDFQNAVTKLDWEVKSKSNINSRCQDLAVRVLKCSAAFKRCENFVKNARARYLDIDEYSLKYGTEISISHNKSDTTVDSNGLSTTTTKTNAEYERISSTKEPGYSVQRTTKENTSEEKTTNKIFETTTKTTSSTEETYTEKKQGNWSSTDQQIAYQKSHEETVSPSGKKVSDRSVTYERIYNEHVEKGDESADAGFYQRMGVTETTYGIKSDGSKILSTGYQKGESYDLVDAEARYSYTLIESGVNVNGDLNSVDIDTPFDIQVGTITAGTGGKIGIDENGKIVASADAELTAKLVSMSFSPEIVVGNVKVTTKVTGYVGLGAEAGISYHDDKITVKLGAGLGVGLGLEVTIEPAGKAKEIIDNMTTMGDVIEGFEKYGINYLGHLVGVW